MKIIVYGPGCAKCKQTEELVKRVVADTGVNADVEKVSDIREMIAAGIMSTPAIAIDGVMKVVGRVPGADEVKKWITE